MLAAPVAVAVPALALVEVTTPALLAPPMDAACPALGFVDGVASLATPVEMAALAKALRSELVEATALVATPEPAACPAPPDAWMLEVVAAPEETA